MDVGRGGRGGEVEWFELTRFCRKFSTSWHVLTLGGKHFRLPLTVLSESCDSSPLSQILTVPQTWQRFNMIELLNRLMLIKSLPLYMGNCEKRLRLPRTITKTGPILKQICQCLPLISSPQHSHLSAYFFPKTFKKERKISFSHRKSIYCTSYKLCDILMFAIGSIPSWPKCKASASNAKLTLSGVEG